MKAIKHIIPCLYCTALLMACSSENEGNESETKVPLEISIGNNTRSIIEGTTIPTQTQFGIFGEYNQVIKDVDNMSVFYDGKCKLSKDVYLNNSSMHIKAYYPYSSKVEKGIAEIDIRDQIDFLYGSAVDSKGELQIVNNSNPKANIVFKHALSRLTFKVRHTAAYGGDFKLTEIFISPVYVTANFNVISQELTTTFFNEPTFPLNLTVTKDFTSFDLLMIPLPENSHPRWILFSGDNISYGNTTLEGEWAAGQQYTYEVTFDDNGIKVSEAVITPWESSTQPGIDITDDNLVNK